MRAPENIYQLKISLDNTRPPIWRRILIPTNTTFRNLHETIQLSFGWSDCHLHDFQLGNRLTRQPRSITDISFEDVEPWWDNDEKSDEKRVKLCDVFHSTGDGCKYWYDFGDDWWHSIVLEKILPAVEGIDYPICIKGKRACPPDDCGGPWGYADLCSILAQPSHPDHEEKLEWLGLNNASEFDPEDFDVDATNELLRDGYEILAPFATK